MPFSPALVEDIELKKFKDTPGAREAYSTGVSLIRKSGIVNFLRIFARPFSVDRGANPHQAAYTAAFTEGYNKALDDLMYFEEMYLTETLGKKKITATFGGIGLALSRGDLTKEEVNGK